jgi:hypothetical protein
VVVIRGEGILQHENGLICKGRDGEGYVQTRPAESLRM